MKDLEVSLRIPIQLREWCHHHDEPIELCPYLVGYPEECEIRPRPGFSEDFGDRMADLIRAYLRGLADARSIVDDFIRRKEGREPTPTSLWVESLGAVEQVERFLLTDVDGRWLDV